MWNIFIIFVSDFTELTIFTMKRSEDYRKMINSARWVRLRRLVIGEHPVCELCEQEGFVTASREVHHRVPVEDGATPADRERLMFNPANLEALCHRCHVRRHMELGRGGKAATKRRNNAQGASLDRLLYGE